MRILALDLGTKTGWALADDDLISSGTWVLATRGEIAKQAKEGKDRCCDRRFKLLQALIRDQFPLGAIYFEDVEFSTFTYQTQLWAGFRTVVSLMYPNRVPKVVAVPVGTLKKFATGKGNASKEMMAQSLQRYDSGRFILSLTATDSAGKWGKRMDDNEVDALHLLRYAIRDLRL
jgi:hypothetical protein